jgi:hypothetical protein
MIDITNSYTAQPFDNLVLGDPPNNRGTIVSVPRDDLIAMQKTIEALQARVAEARNAALEDAAKVADAARDEWPSRASDYACGASDYSVRIAAAIRAMKGERG